MTRKIGLLLAAMALAGCGGDDGGDGAQAGPTALEVAFEACGPERLTSPAGVEYQRQVELGDAGRTLTIRGEGEESEGVDIMTIACFLNALDASDAVTSQMDSTRAMDGRQTGSWDGYTASWTYHPNSGFNLIVEIAG